jgi:hypothetical protein
MMLTGRLNKPQTNETMTIKREPKPCASGCWYHFKNQMFGGDHQVLAVTSWGRIRYAMVFVGWQPLEVDRKRLAHAIREARKEVKKARKEAA